MPDAKVLFSREGRSLGEVKVIEATGTSITVEVPIRVEDEPDFFVSALFLKDNKFYQGTKRLVVPPRDKKLSVAVTSSKAQFKPGETGQFTVEAKDSTGKPVQGEFSVGIVDEALYGVRADRTLDIAQIFYGPGYNTIDTNNSMVYYFHGEAGKRRMMLAELANNRHRLAQLKPDRFVQPKVRKEFPDTALWLPAVKTGADGKGIANVTFPDSVTTWRTTTRGITADSKVGSATLKTIVRKNVILRMVTPRFFTQNDEVTISAVIHNYLINDKQARVSLAVKGLDIIDGGTRDIALPSRGEVRVDWRVRASSLGDAVLTGKVLTNEESDAVEITLPVEPQGVKITRSRSGSQSGALNIAFPQAVVPLSRKLEISVSPSIAGALFGAIDYLTEFPYGCTEQTLSSFVPNVIVSKALSDLNIKSDVNQQLLAVKIRAGLDRLYDFQHEDGGYGWWKTDDSGIFMTTAVIAGLSQAKAAGVEIKSGVLENSATWLKAAYPKEPKMLADLKAYSIYALSLAGDNSLIEDGWKQRSDMTAYGRALAGLGLGSRQRSSCWANGGHSRIRREVQRVRSLVAQRSRHPHGLLRRHQLRNHSLRPETPRPPEAPERPATQGRRLPHESPQRRLLLVLHQADRHGDLRPHRLPQSHRRTEAEPQSFRNSERQTGPDQSLPTRRRASHQRHQDRSPRCRCQRHQDRIQRRGTPLLVGQTDLLLHRPEVAQDGQRQPQHPSRLLQAHPGKDGEKIVYGLDPLQGPLAIGDILAVRITVTGTDWKYLMMEDPIPAGSEFIERDDLYELKARPDWWSTYFTRREFHDDRAAFFQTFFYGGQKQYFYLLKIVNPGTFKVSPARVQPMYQPDILSTTENKEVVIK